MKIKQLIKYFIYRFKWHTAKYINYSFPIHIDIELSTYCNLNCSFCFRQTNNYPTKFINKKLAFDIIDQAKKLGVKSIKFNWRGESTLHPDFDSIINYAKIKNLYTMLNTNLSVIYNMDKITSLVMDIDELKVSIDTSIPAKYEKIRKGARWQNTLHNLYYISSCREINNMPKIILNRRTDKNSESDKEFKNYFGNRFKYDIHQLMERNQKIKVERKRKYCGQPSRRMVIDVDGNVWVCCVAYKQQRELYLGNVNNSSLKEIWNNEKRIKLINNLKKNILCNACLNCTSGDSYE